MYSMSVPQDGGAKVHVTNVTEVSRLLSLFRMMAPFLALRRSPAELPYSSALLATVVFWALLLDLASAYLMQQDLARSALIYMLYAGFFAVAVSVMLAQFGRSARRRQTLTAAFGAAALFQLVQLVMVVVLQLGMPRETVVTLLQLTWLWSLVVDGYIFSQALELNLLLGCVLSLAIFVPQLMVITALVPAS